MDIDTIGAEMLARTVTTTFVGGPLDGATREMHLDVVLAGAAARATEIVTEHPESGESIEGVPYRLVVSVPREDEGVLLDPMEWETPKALWIYAGPIETVL